MPHEQIRMRHPVISIAGTGTFLNIICVLSVGEQEALLFDIIQWKLVSAEACELRESDGLYPRLSMVYTSIKLDSKSNVGNFVYHILGKGHAYSQFTSCEGYSSMQSLLNGISLLHFPSSLVGP